MTRAGERVNSRRATVGTCRALARRMHHLPFSFKRAHHATLKLLAPIAARAGLTPARFDLLYVLHVKGDTVEPYQFRIAQVLGLCRSTICKMIKAMEKAGLVARNPEMLFDHRRRRVTLTRYGRHCIRLVLKAIRRREVEKPLLQSASFYRCNTHDKRFDFILDLANSVQRVLIGLHGGWVNLVYPVPFHTESQRMTARHHRLLKDGVPECEGSADIITQDLAEAVD
jgi:DNA-binding MarR family transcriptional regulator